MFWCINWCEADLLLEGKLQENKQANPEETSKQLSLF